MAKMAEHDTSEEQETPELALSGVLADQLYVLETSKMVLATTFARSNNGGSVLLPLIDWQMLGRTLNEGSDQEVAFEALLALDNIAFLLRDMSSAFREAVENLEELTAAAPGLSQINTARMRDWLLDVTKQAEATIECLDRLGPSRD